MHCQYNSLDAPSYPHFGRQYYLACVLTPSCYHMDRNPRQVSHAQFLNWPEWLRKTERKSRMMCPDITQSASITSCSLNRAPVSLSDVAQEFLFTLEAELEVSGSLCQEPSHFRFMLETYGPLTPSPVSNSGWKIWHWICGAGCPLLVPVVYILPKLCTLRASPFCFPTSSPFSVLFV